LVSTDDSLILEDEFGRVGLIGATAADLPVSALVTGVVVAVVGVENDGGLFAVSKVIYPEMAPQPPFPDRPQDAPPRYVLFVSGLSFGEPTHDPLPTQMLADYITGFIGSQSVRLHLFPRRSRVLRGHFLIWLCDVMLGPATGF
jgi:hypothetical protein